MCMKATQANMVDSVRDAEHGYSEQETMTLYFANDAAHSNTTNSRCRSVFGDSADEGHKENRRVLETQRSPY